MVLLRGIAAGAFLGAESFVPLMLVTERGLSATQAGLSLTGGGLTWALGSYTQSRLRLEPYRERLMTAGMLLMAVAIGLAPLALADSVPAGVVAVAWVSAASGWGWSSPAAVCCSSSCPAPKEAGSNSASLQVSDALGNITLVGLSGVLFVGFGGRSVGADHAGRRGPRRVRGTRGRSRRCMWRWRRWRWWGRG